MKKFIFFLSGIWLVLISPVLADTKATVDLITSSMCRNSGNGKISDCRLEPQKTQESPLSETAVDLRTRIMVQRTPNCRHSGESVPLSLRAVFSGVESAENFTFDFLRQNQSVLRPKKAGIIKYFSISHKSDYFFSQMIFPESCRISLIVHLNEPDVDSSYEARQIIFFLERDEQKKRQHEELMMELKTFRPLFTVLQTVLKDTLRKMNLTRKALKEMGLLDLNTDSFQKLLDISHLDLSSEDKEILSRFMEWVEEAQNNPENFSQVTLEDLFSPEEQDSLMKVGRSQNLLVDDKRIEEAKEEWRTAQSKLKLAKQQLTHLLSLPEQDLSRTKKTLEELLEDQFNGPLGIVAEFEKKLKIKK